MRIAIVHFHLQTGGVTRVIQHTCEALTDAGHEILVLTGETPQQPLGCNVKIAVLSGLGYEERRDGQTPDALAAAMLNSAREAFRTAPDLWHVHNHGLGKNLALPGALLRLARNGQRLLLQPHDFAEDGRPALYRRLRNQLADGDIGRLSALLYPLAPQIHYAVLNARDLDFLTDAGIPDANIHLLANAVSLPGPKIEAAPTRTRSEAGADGQRLWLYPTRAIRRKNLGEFLLWSALGNEQDHFATTQAPQNPQEQAHYRRWVALATELDLPVTFELGNKVDNFQDLMMSSHALVTTSVGEGFGLAFLEPWLSGKPLAGRDLPEITRDFRNAGIALDNLYERLLVPLSWLDVGRLQADLSAALSTNARAYGRQLDADALTKAWQSMLVNACIDMGRLNETAQEMVIRRLHSSPAERAELTPTTLDATSSPEVIATNDATIRTSYGLSSYGQRLESIYTGIINALPSAHFDHADGDLLLNRFLAPERLTLLRT
ncbi:MAG TPA: hypothetical protein DDY14_12090 [Chromatiaceae bacterium]|jgi:hypothetical protein|nr:MAG: hypothetical protein N838_00205 [Thiohalocapsa sp. PB-PSB1]HBG96020.1 hypothetical protein [Chromatiaceae bacterium]HCS88900.1 hypothetical protein [Chromatiaceae bacterium]